ncbi:MAG: hypothetical protein RLZZ524_1918, partial [Pseudomonadota bacterium]
GGARTRPVLRPGMGMPGTSVLPRTMPGRVPLEPPPADPAPSESADPAPEAPGSSTPGTGS